MYTILNMVVGIMHYKHHTGHDSRDNALQTPYWT